jgi:putative membrane protein
MGARARATGVEVVGMLVQLIAQTIVDGIALWFAALVVDGVHFDGDLLALTLTALLFGIMNLVIRPFIVLLTLPLTTFTFGLFLLVVNALMLLLTGALSRSYSVDGLWAAFLGGLLISLVNFALHLVVGDRTISWARRPGGA